MLAPASRQRRASATISSGVIGTCGLFRFVGTMPVMAALMISFSMAVPLPGCSLTHHMLLDNACRHADDLNVVRYVASDHGPRAHDRMGPDGDAVEHDRAHA